MNIKPVCGLCRMHGRDGGCGVMASKFNIGDKIKRIDCYDPKEYIIDKIREHKGYWIYSMDGQGWKDGWTWVAEWNVVEVGGSDHRADRSSNGLPLQAGCMTKSAHE